MAIILILISILEPNNIKNSSLKDAVAVEKNDEI